MLKYALGRILLMLTTLLIITFICFVLIRMLPLPSLPPDDPHTQQVLDRREALGYNKPYIVQFGIFLKSVFTRWDWGLSEGKYFGREVASIFAQKLPITMLVNLYSIVLSIPFGIALGILAALKKNRATDHIISTATMIAISVPSFVYAFLIQYILCFKLRAFPMVVNIEDGYFNITAFWSMMPAVLSLALGVVAGFTRVTRAELTEVLTSEFMLLARTKGLTKAQATVRHALKSCMVVILPSIFGEFVGILSGSLIIEKIFSVSGVGSLYFQSIGTQDYPMFTMLTVFYTAIGLAAGIVVDISYGIIDPRIRVGSKR